MQVKVAEKRPLEEIPGFTDASARVEQQMNGEGRVFVRYSGTENKMRILLEYTDMEQMQAWGEELAQIVRKEIGND
jgi:phosphoglucosamine mutase